MKKIFIPALLVCVLTCWGTRGRAQAQELEQLALNIEKLVQFKQILSDLKKAYEVLYKGYTTIKNIAQGNFSLHETFLNGLLEASPAVKKYVKIADIVRLQVALVKEYTAAYQYSKNSGHFTRQELEYMETIYTRLFNDSVKQLDDLVNILTANKLRMSDADRLRSIDGIYSGMSQKIAFLRHFNNSNSLLGIQRSHEQRDVDVMRKLYDTR
jgi:DNA repair ATPase RecN